jgi:hypothetical protein
MTPEEAAVAARAREEKMVYLTGGIVAGIGGLVFWGLNSLERSGRRNRQPRHGLDSDQTPIEL